MIMSHTTFAQGVSARHTIHVSCACVFDLSSTLSSHSSLVSPIFYFILLIIYFIFHVDRFGVKPPVRFREWGVWPFGQQRPSHRLWAQLRWRLLLLRDQWNFHPGVLQRQQALVPAWLGDQWLHHRQKRALSSPLFAQEREEPAGRGQAYHSHEESLLSSQSLSVGHVRTGRLVNEFGSLCSSVRENSCRDSENEQIRILLERQNEHILTDCRDSETRVPSRLWQKKSPKIEWNYRVSTRWD